MTLTHSQERIPAAERIAVRCVDSDVHPVPRRGELWQYIPEPWRSKYFGTHPIGEQIYYDAPDYAHSYAMRVDTFPTDGEFAGSDPDLDRRCKARHQVQALRRHGNRQRAVGFRLQGFGERIARLAIELSHTLQIGRESAGV